MWFLRLNFFKIIVHRIKAKNRERDTENKNASLLSSIPQHYSGLCNVFKTYTSVRIWTCLLLCVCFHVNGITLQSSASPFLNLVLELPLSCTKWCFTWRYKSSLPEGRDHVCLARCLWTLPGTLSTHVPYMEALRLFCSSQKNVWEKNYPLAPNAQQIPQEFSSMDSKAGSACGLPLQAPGCRETRFWVEEPFGASVSNAVYVANKEANEAGRSWLRSGFPSCPAICKIHPILLGAENPTLIAGSGFWINSKIINKEL